MKSIKTWSFVLLFLLLCSTVVFSAPLQTVKNRLINPAIRQAVIKSAPKWNPVAKYSIPGTNVFALAVDSNNKVYAGGLLPWPYGPNIFSWSGASTDLWMTMGSGLNGPVKSIATYGNNIYAMGDFAFSGNTSTNHIAVWNGSSWSGMSTGLEQASAVATDADGNVYVAQNLPAISYVRKWNDSSKSWDYLQSFNGAIYALTFDPSSKLLYVGGSFAKINLGAANEKSVNNLAVCNVKDRTWDAALGTAYNPIKAIAVANGVIYIAGNFNAVIKKEPGAGWTAVGGTFDGLINALAVKHSNTDNVNIVYAGGTFTKNTTSGITINANHVAVWNGSAWDPMSSGLNGTVNALAIDSNGNLYAGGNFSSSGSTPISRVARWGF